MAILQGNILKEFFLNFIFRNESSFCDPFLKIYDVRNLKPMNPFSISLQPVQCKFANPFGDGQLIVGSKVRIYIFLKKKIFKHGHVMRMDLNGSKMEPLNQYCNGPVRISISKTKQCACIGDNSTGRYYMIIKIIHRF